MAGTGPVGAEPGCGEGICILASVTVGEVVMVPTTMARRRARWEGLQLSGGRAAS